MHNRPLGTNGPRISVVGYGAWEAGGAAWGPAPPDDVVVEAIAAGFDAGIDWIDTAEIYGNGHSEEVVARAIKNRPEARTFTKVASAPRGSGYRPEEIRAAAERSLRRLGRDVIDVFQLHWLDERDVPLEETWGAMAGLVDAGLVRWIGVSNFTVEAIERCERIRHVDSLQPHFSMLWQERRPLLRFCERNGTGVIAYGPLAFGLLTGAITRETRFPDDDWRGGGHDMRAYTQLFAPGRFEANLDVVSALVSVAERLGITPPQLALAWVLHQPGVTGAIAGSRSSEHVRENAWAASIVLSLADLAEIERTLEGRGEVTAIL